MGEKTELRWEADRVIVDVLDAVSGARCMSLHEANAIARVMRGNPLLSEAAGNVSESGGKRP